MPTIPSDPRPITLNPGTPSEITADPGEINVPDLWHIAELIKGPSNTIYLPREKREAIGNAILETWHLAHAFRRYLIDHPADLSEQMAQTIIALLEDKREAL